MDASSDEASDEARVVMEPAPFGLLLGLFWTPYADWLYTAVSSSGLLLVVWLVLRPPKPPAP